MARNLVTVINESTAPLEISYRSPATKPKDGTQEVKVLRLGSKLDADVAEQTKDEEDPRDRIASPEVKVERSEWEAILANPAAAATLKALMDQRKIRVIV